MDKKRRRWPWVLAGVLLLSVTIWYIRVQYYGLMNCGTSAEDMTHAVNWARDMGVIDGSFDENTPCTRATAVTYIWKAFGQPSMGSNSFTDVPADSASAVSWAVAKGVTNGTSTITFSPDKVCDRGEIVTFLYRAYH